VLAAALALVALPGAVVATAPRHHEYQRSVCVDSDRDDAHNPDSVDWLIHCGHPAMPARCAELLDAHCEVAGDGHCCMLSRAVPGGHGYAAAEARVTKAPASAHAGIVLVVYDSDLRAAALAESRLHAYGRVAVITRPFDGYGSKWTALAEFLTSFVASSGSGQDIFVVLDARDVLPNAFSRATFDKRIRGLAASASGRRKVVRFQWRVGRARCSSGVRGLARRMSTWRASLAHAPIGPCVPVAVLHAAGRWRGAAHDHVANNVVSAAARRSFPPRARAASPRWAGTLRDSSRTMAPGATAPAPP